MTIPALWTPGDQVVLQGVWRGKVWFVRAVTVVEHRPDYVVLHIPVGAPGAHRVKPDGSQVRIFQDGCVFEETVWRGGNALYLARFDTRHAVMVFWEEGHSTVRSWYVNLQEPIYRTPIGFAFTDQLLDIVIKPDLSSWRWKDEDELEEAVEQGLFSRAEVDEIRAEGLRALEQMQAGRWPYSDGWERWQPDPLWPVPKLPEGWDRFFQDGKA